MRGEASCLYKPRSPDFGSATARAGDDETGVRAGLHMYVGAGSARRAREAGERAPAARVQRPPTPIGAPG